MVFALPGDVIAQPVPEFNGGDGTLTLNNGRQYNFALKGLDVASVGISKVNAEGKVYHSSLELADKDRWWTMS
jgi:phage-related protein